MMKFDLRIGVVAAALALGLSGPSYAAAVDILDVNGAPTSVVTTGYSVTTSPSAVALGVTGAKADRADPWAGTAHKGVASYDAISKGGSVTFTFDVMQSALKILWGTIDSFNVATFFDADGNVVDSLIGSDIASGNGSYYLEIFAAPFKSVTLSSKGIAFEYAAVEGVPASVVPVPAAGLLLAGAMAGLGVAARRRHRAA